MLTKELIRSLKQSNVSRDRTKTAQRTKMIWGRALPEQKDHVCALASIARSTMYRVFTVGCISAKIVSAMAQTLDVDPFYLTGESNELGVCTEQRVKIFLRRQGYQHLFPEDFVSEIEHSGVAIEAEDIKMGKNGEDDETVPDEDLLVLLHSLVIRAKTGRPGSKELLKQIKTLLLS